MDLSALLLAHRDSLSGAIAHTRHGWRTHQACKGTHLLGGGEDDVPTPRLGIYAALRGTMVIQSGMGHTEAHRVQPVQSSVTVGRCVSALNLIAW